MVNKKRGEVTFEEYLKDNLNINLKKEFCKLPISKQKKFFIKTINNMSKNDLNNFINKGLPTIIIWDLLDKPKSRKEILFKLLKEPDKKEGELKDKVEAWLIKEQYKVADEIPIPFRNISGKKDKKRARRIDVAGYKKTRREMEIYGVEIKRGHSVAEFERAFTQANLYRDYCEYVSICFSPYVFIKRFHEIKDLSKDTKINKTFGILVANKKLVNELRPPTRIKVRDSKQEEIWKEIERKR